MTVEALRTIIRTESPRSSASQTMHRPIVPAPITAILLVGVISAHRADERRCQATRVPCRLRCTTRAWILRPAPAGPASKSVIRGEEEEVDCKEERARVDRAARV